MSVAQEIHQEPIRTRTGMLFVLVCSVGGFIFAGNIFLNFLNTPPSDFPVGTKVVIENGLNLKQITEVLEQNHVIRSSLYLYIILNHEDIATALKAGSYVFESPQTGEEVAQALIQGSNISPFTTLTLPEGFRIRDFSYLLPPSLQQDTYTEFMSAEGYLFPDTYFVSSTMTLKDTVTLLQDTFTQKIAPYKEEIRASGFTEEEVVILASIIEREAKSNESKKIVSGILHNRLEINMALQVDAVFDYILDKTSSELTGEDLQIDSPYNTYEFTGLPPTPIANPGIESIEAVLRPHASEYLYYLTGKDGTFHYAKTFEQHKRNKELYLR